MIDSAPASGFFALVLVVAALYGSQAIAIRAFGDEGDTRSVRWSAAIAIGIWTAIATFHALAYARAFRIHEALAVAVLGALLVYGASRVSPARVVRVLGGDVRAWLVRVLGHNARYKPLRALLAVAIGQVFFRALILPPLGHDTLTYHGVKAALWVQNAGALVLDLPGAWHMYRHFPPGGEILGAWAMLPFHADTLYLLTDVMVWLGWVPALLGLCAEFGIGARLRMPVVLYVLTCAAIYYFTPSGYVDGTLHLLLLTTLLFTLRALRVSTPAAAACVALGCALTALTVKVTAIGVPVLVGLALAWRFLTDARVRWPLLRGSLVGLVIGAATVGPVLVRNTIEQGFPLSPFRVELFGLTLGQRSPELAWYSDPTLVVATLQNEWLQLSHLIGLGNIDRPTFGPFALPLLLLAPFGLYSLFRERRAAALLVGLFVAYQCAAYVLPDFAPVRLRQGYSTARLFCLAPTFAALLAARLLPRPGMPVLETYLLAASLFSAAVYARVYPSPVEHTPLLVLAGCGFVALLVFDQLASRTSASVVGAAALGLCCALSVIGTGPLQSKRAELRYQALMTSRVGHAIPIEWTALAPMVDDPLHPLRIAVAAGPRQRANRHLLYYFFGSKLQNELIYVSTRADGKLPTYDGNALGEFPIAPDAWVARTRASGVTYVIALAPGWYERHWMMQRPFTFEMVARSTRSWLFRFR